MHVSNLYRIPQAERLAQRLVDATFADSVFFCNSGAEANEGMIKMMRRAMFDAGKPERFRFICSRARSTAARWPRSPRPATRNTWKASARWSKASTTCRSTT